MANQSRRSKKLTASMILSSDMIYDLYCEVCSEDGQHIEAEGLCVDCQDYLCKKCFKGHRSTRSSRNHVLQDSTQMPHQKPSPTVIISSTGVCTEKCTLHPDKLVEYYCWNDKSLGCSVCITIDHRLCNSVDHIPELDDTILASYYKQFTRALDSLTTKSQTLINSTKENVRKAGKCYNDAENMLQELRKRMNEAFDKFEGDLKLKASTIQSDDLTKMQDISEKGQAVFEEVTIILTVLQNLQSKNQLSQLFIHMIQLEDKVKTLHKLLIEAVTENSVSAYTIECSEIQKIIDDPTSISKLSIQATARPKLSHVLQHLCRRRHLHNPLQLVVQSAATTPPIAKDPNEIKAPVVSDVNVRTKRDTKECWISGSALMARNKFILVDCENNKVKLLNLVTSTVSSVLVTASGPWDVTSITADQAAVTLPYSKMIVFLKATERLKKEREMPVAGACEAIIHNKGKLIVAFIQPRKIEIMALDGSVEGKIEQSGLFEFPSHMTLSLDSKTIYVADSVGRCVKIISLDGAIEAGYRDNELDHPRGLTVDQHGRVLVRGGRFTQHPPAHP